MGAIVVTEKPMSLDHFDQIEEILGLATMNFANQFAKVVLEVVDSDDVISLVPELSEQRRVHLRENEAGATVRFGRGRIELLDNVAMSVVSDENLCSKLRCRHDSDGGGRRGNLMTAQFSLWILYHELSHFLGNHLLIKSHIGDAAILSAEWDADMIASSMYFRNVSLGHREGTVFNRLGWDSTKDFLFDAALAFGRLFEQIATEIPDPKDHPFAWQRMCIWRNEGLRAIAQVEPDLVWDAAEAIDDGLAFSVTASRSLPAWLPSSRPLIAKDCMKHRRYLRSIGAHVVRRAELYDDWLSRRN